MRGAIQTVALPCSEPELRNPSITLKYGETVELVLRNDDSKQVVHCFTIGGLNVKTARNLDSGETETLTFKPTQQGIFTYACLMHPQMAGKIIVQ